MAHDSFNCQNEELLKISAVKMFPFPTERGSSNYYVGAVGHEQTISPCPVACRPPQHKDWLYC